MSAALDEQGIARVWFRSQRNPVVALDLTGAQKLSQQMEAAGELQAGQELAGLVKAAQAMKQPGAGAYGTGVYGADVYGSGGSDITRIAADRQRRVFAESQTGPVEPIGPLSFDASLNASGGLTVRTDADVVHAAGKGAEPSFAANVSERPQEVLAAIRGLTKAIHDEIDQQRANKRNDPQGADQQNEFISFLEQIAAGLVRIAKQIESAIKSADKKKQTFFLGKAAEFAAQLGTTVRKGLERNRAYITDCSFKFATIAAGCIFLRAVGFDTYLASIIAGFIGGVPLDKIKLGR